MTYREKMTIEHPGYIDEKCMGGVAGCPDDKKKDICRGSSEKCRACWDREIPGSEPVKKPESSDNVNHPSHYQGKHECVDEMIAMFGVEAVKHFCMCNVYKYRFRAAAKNGQEDLDKANWYMDKLMELNGSDKG